MKERYFINKQKYRELNNSIQYGKGIHDEKEKEDEYNEKWNGEFNKSLAKEFNEQLKLVYIKDAYVDRLGISSIILEYAEPCIYEERHLYKDNKETELNYKIALLILSSFI